MLKILLLLIIEIKEMRYTIVPKIILFSLLYSIFRSYYNMFKGEIVMNDYLEYQRSIALEFQAYKNRVRNMIGNSHWGEEGRYKEILLMNYLRRILPNTVSVGTGFVRVGDKLTNQIDIIVYRNNLPLLFQEGDFIIATPQSIVAIIEVKSRLYLNNLKKVFEKANSNGKIICSKTGKGIFNGIFAYDKGTGKIETYAQRLEELDYSKIIGNPSAQGHYPYENYSCVNHMVLENKTFVKYWPTGYTKFVYHDDPIKSPYYGFYDMPDELAITYFISNLQECVLEETLSIPQQENYDLDELRKFLYPIDGGKEQRLICKAIMAKWLSE